MSIKRVAVSVKTKLNVSGELIKKKQSDIALRLILKNLCSCSTLKKYELNFLAYESFCTILINKLINKEKATTLYQRLVDECAIDCTFIFCHSCVRWLQLRKWGERKNGRKKGFQLLPHRWNTNGRSMAMWQEKKRYI